VQCDLAQVVGVSFQAGQKTADQLRTLCLSPSTTMLAAGVSSASRDPGETLKCCTLVGAKRVAKAERQPAAEAERQPAAAAKRQRTQLLPPAAVAVLGESGTAYHKLVEFGRRVDLTLKHHHQALEARLRAAGVGPKGEIVSAYPAAPFHPVTRILRLHVDFQHESALDPQLPTSTRWMLRLWGVYADRSGTRYDLRASTCFLFVSL
jgi:hypothetical protein